MTVSFEREIRPLFRNRDINCMSPDWPLNVYDFMSAPAGNEDFPDHGNARTVYARLRPDTTAERMPKGGPYWTDAQLALYQRWMDEGFQP